MEFNTPDPRQDPHSEIPRELSPFEKDISKFALTVIVFVIFFGLAALALTHLG